MESNIDVVGNLKRGKSSGRVSSLHACTMYPGNLLLAFLKILIWCYTKAPKSLSVVSGLLAKAVICDNIGPPCDLYRGGGGG